MSSPVMACSSVEVTARLAYFKDEFYRGHNELCKGVTAFTVGCFVALSTPAFAEPNVTAQQDCKRRAKPTIGMTANELLASCWGAPKGSVKTTRPTGTAETFFYKAGTVKFIDGKIIEIVEAR
jgi:hypothetical protein